MRRPLIGDAMAAARVVAGAPEGEAAAAARALVARAERAVAWRLATGRPHPTLGDGSLMAASLGMRPAVEARLSDPRYRRALAQVLLAL